MIDACLKCQGKPLKLSIYTYKMKDRKVKQVGTSGRRESIKKG
jgi:hypothetical protein